MQELKAALNKIFKGDAYELWPLYKDVCLPSLDEFSSFKGGEVALKSKMKKTNLKKKKSC